MIVGKERSQGVKVIDGRLDQNLQPRPRSSSQPDSGYNKVEGMKKKVSRVSDTGVSQWSRTHIPGSAYGCLRKWQDLNAIPHIVRPFPMKSAHSHGNQPAPLSQLK